MSESILVSILSLFGTLIGSLCGILTANKLTLYRIQQLEKKVEKHNGVIDRVYALEKHEAVMQEDINLVLANSMFISALVLVGMVVSDILLAIVDPRIRYGKE